MDDTGRILALEALIDQLCALTGAAAFLEHPSTGTVRRFGELPGWAEGGAAQIASLEREIGADGARWRLSAAQDVADRVAAERDRVRYRAIVEAQTDWIARQRPDGRLTFVNEAYCRWMGMSREELLGPDYSGFDLIDDPDDLARFHANRAALTPGRATAVNEIRTRHPDGSRRWEQWTDTAIFDGDGKVIEYQLVGREITEQREARRALEESEVRYRAVVEDLTEIVGRYDPDFTLTFTNAAHARVVGRPVDALIGQDFFVEVPERLRPELRRRLLALTPERPTDVGENEKVLADGSARWFHWTNRALFDAGGTLTGYQSVGRDITELKQAESALREREALLGAILATQTEWVTRQDLRSRYTFVNPAYCRYMGMTAEQLCAADYDDYGSVEPDDRARFFALRETMSPERPSFTIELRARHTDGSLRIEEWIETGIFDAAGRLQGYQAVGRDLTAQREAERQIQRQREQLLQQEKLAALGSLLAGVAHELNNPLSVVVGYAALLREDARDKAIREQARQIHVAAQRCARIVSTFLDMARQKPPAFGPVDLARCVDDALGIVDYPLRSGGVVVIRRLPADLPPVQGDADQLHQVITNLVINAQQALTDRPEPRRIEIAAAVVGGQVELAIADNGPGIPLELRRRVFEPFFTTKPQGAGTGLGLAVCHGILTTHGGSIDLDCPPEGGTVVRVRLPAAALAGRRRPRAIPRATGSILIVDDEPGIVGSLGDALRRDGHRVEVAGDGRTALTLLERQEVDLVVTDLRMPDMDGLTLIERLRAVAPRLAATALIMTGDTLRASADPALAGYGDRVIEKPVDLAALRRRVRRSLARRAR